MWKWDAFKECESEMLEVKITMKYSITTINIKNWSTLITMLMKIKQNNKNWLYIPDHPYRILIIGGSGSRKTNLLLNLIEDQPDIYKIYLYAKDPYEPKYQYLINKREGVGINQFNDLKLLLSIQTICMMFTKISMNAILIKKIRY